MKIADNPAKHMLYEINKQAFFEGYEAAWLRFSDAGPSLEQMQKEFEASYSCYSVSRYDEETNPNVDGSSC